MSLSIKKLFQNQWTTLTLFTLLSLVCYIDHFILGALLTPIKESLHITDEQLGRISMVTIVVSVFAMPLAGYVGDRHARKWYIFFSLLVWSLASVGSAFAGSFDALLVWRALVGAGAGVFLTLAPGWLVDAFLPSRRGVVLAVLQSTGQISAWIAYYFGAMIAAKANWQEAFFLSGVPGLALLVFVPFLQEPRRGQADDLAHDEPHQPIYGEIVSLFKNSAYVVYLLGYTVRMVGVMGLFFWGAVLFHRQYGISNQAAVGFVGAAYPLTGAPGIFLAGYFAGKLALRFRGSYAFWLVGGEFLAALSFGALVFFLPPLPYAKALFLAAVFFSGHCWGVLRPLLFEIAPVRSRNIAVSGSLLAESVGSAFLASELIGYASDHLGIAHALYLGPAAYFAAALIWTALGVLQVRSRQRIQAVDPVPVPELVP